MTTTVTAKEQAQKERDDTESGCVNNTNPKSQISQLGEMLLDGHQAWKYTTKDCFADSASIYVANGDEVFRISLIYPGITPLKQAQYEETVNKILSTFKFISTKKYSNQPTTAQTYVVNYDGDGAFKGYIRSMNKMSNGKYTVGVDFIQWLGDSPNNNFQGSRACVEDGECRVAPGECDPENGRGCLLDGYYIRNQNTKIRTIEVANDAIIENLASPSNGVIPRRVSISELVTIFASQDEGTKWLRDAVYNVEIHDGIATKISQQYRP